MTSSTKFATPNDLFIGARFAAPDGSILECTDQEGDLYTLRLEAISPTLKLAPNDNGIRHLRPGGLALLKLTPKPAGDWAWADQVFFEHEISETFEVEDTEFNIETGEYVYFNEFGGTVTITRPGYVEVLL